MMCNQVNDEMIQSIISAKAWNDISSNYGLTEEMLERYADKLNWNEVSKNSEIHWTVKLIEKWANRLNWEELSGNGNEYLLTPDVIAYFVNRWNWHTLSRNSNLKLDFTFVDRFIDKWDWQELIDSWRREDFYTKEFFDRYRSHIPLTSFLENSRLVNELVEKEMEQIKKELTSHC
ncbi:MAG: hypothetical protein K5864_09835 [Bacteroidales bacterium]|nr:hypothetical protein [Bacteroidales bacterium]